MGGEGKKRILSLSVYKDLVVSRHISAAPPRFCRWIKKKKYQIHAFESQRARHTLPRNVKKKTTVGWDVSYSGSSKVHFSSLSVLGVCARPQYNRPTVPSSRYRLPTRRFFLQAFARLAKRHTHSLEPPMCLKRFYRCIKTVGPCLELMHLPLLCVRKRKKERKKKPRVA